MGTPTHEHFESVTAASSTTTKTFSDCAEGDLLVLFVQMTTSNTRTWTISDDRGGTWSAQVIGLTNGRYVIMAWRLVTAGDGATVVAQAAQSGAFSAYWLIGNRARPAAGEAFELVEVGGPLAETSSGTHHCDDVGVDMPAGSIGYASGVLTATAAATLTPVAWTSLIAGTTRINHYHVAATASPADRAAFTIGGTSRTGVSLMAVWASVGDDPPAANLSAAAHFLSLMGA